MKAPFNDEIAASVAAARAVRDHAHTPYSQFKVGAALKISGTAKRIVGCNVENVSYGATVCAERNAIFAAVARYGSFTVEHLVIYTNDDPPAVPCALCLQVLQEFCPPELPIHLANADGVQSTMTLGELLPHPFSAFNIASE